MLKTPNNRSSVAVLATFLYLSAPIVEWFYYRTELGRGSYTVNADSIGLPIGRFTVVCLIGLPLLAALLWLVLRSYPGSVSLLGFNTARPYWSIVWSMIFAYPVIRELVFCVESAFLGNPLDVAHAGLMSYLMLCLRGSIVYGGLSFSRNKFASTTEA